MPTWEATNAEHQRLESTIKGFATKHPSIYALRRDQDIDDVASGTDNANTRQTIATSLQGVLENIATTEGKLSDPKSTLPLELHPVHHQLYATPGSPWSEPFGQGVAKQAIKGYEDAEWWREVGVNALQLALFAVAELATGGAAVFFLALGAGVGVVRAEQDWEKWQEKNAAEKSNLSDETKLLESGTADAALITAVLDTATAFLDLYGAGSAAVREAKGVAALEERLAAAEAKEAGSAIETEIKQKQEWQFKDTVTGEAHTAHATDRGLEICSDPPCMIIPQRMRQRFDSLPGTKSAETEAGLNHLIAGAEGNSTAWQAVKKELDAVVAERDALGALTPRQKIDFNQKMRAIEERMGTLQDASSKLEDNFGALAREHQVRTGIAAEPGMTLPHGGSDAEVRTALGMRADEPCADILAGDGNGKWVISESKGDDIKHAIDQMVHTETRLREASAKDVTKIGTVTDVEYRIYPSPTVYENLGSTGSGRFGRDADGFLTKDSVQVVTETTSRKVRILPPPGG